MHYTQDFLLRADECGRDSTARLTSVTNFLQEAAGYHATLLNLGTDKLLPQGVTWMLLRFKVSLTHLPRWRDTVRVATWPSGVRGRLVATRDYTACILPGETPFLTGTSEWGLVSIEQQRLLRLTDDIRALAPDAPPAAALPRLPELTEAELTRDYPVRESQIDFNHHVNNSHYIAWIMDTLPAATEGMRLVDFDITYRLPALPGDTVSVRSQWNPGDATALHAILRGSDGAALVHAQTLWKQP